LSSTKISAIANAKELLKTETVVKNELNSMEVRDPVTKQCFPLSTFVRMVNFYIPTGAELNGGGIDRRHWKINHLFATAQFYIETAGFPEGKYPNHEEWCHLRNNKYQVSVSVYGEIIRFNDPRIIKYYEDLAKVPSKLYNSINNMVLPVLQKHFVELPMIDEDEPFGALMIFQRHVVWKLVLQCIRAYPQINMALTSIEATPITNTADVQKFEAGANMLLTFKEMACCRPKFSFDLAFFSTTIAHLETQEFATPADRNRAADAIRKVQGYLENGHDFKRSALFDILNGIFRPNLGLNVEADVEAHLAVTAFHANGKENYGARGFSRKENANPQLAKRKSPTKATPEMKAFADLKSEFGNIRADLSAIMNFLGMTDKKPRFQNDMNKHGKEQANLAKIRKPKHTIKIGPAVSFEKRFVDEEDYEASEPEHQRVEHAMFSRIQAAPLPKLTVQSIFGPNSRNGSSRSVWDEDRIGYARPSPRLNEGDLTELNALYSSPKYWENDKSSSTSSKTSLTTRTQLMEICEEQLYAKQIELRKSCNSSPYAERLLAD
jgi:hypothetical protein